MYNNFNPGLPEPWNVIHPFQLPAVRQFCENTFSPDIEAIYLFGGSLDLSCHIYSDLDFYVITSNPDIDKVYEHVYEKCLPLKKRFDILVALPDDFAQYHTQHGTIESKIAEKGIRIYAK
jgi:predicted nucleotidyltransferase